MRPSFFGFETGETRKFRNLPDEKIGTGRTKRQNIGYFCPAEKVCAGCTIRIGRFLNLLCGGGRIGFCPNRVAQFCSGAIRYAFVAVCCCGRDEPADRIRERRGFARATPGIFQY